MKNKIQTKKKKNIIKVLLKGTTVRMEVTSTIVTLAASQWRESSSATRGGTTTTD